MRHIDHQTGTVTRLYSDRLVYLGVSFGTYAGLVLTPITYAAVVFAHGFS